MAGGSRGATRAASVDAGIAACIAVVFERTFARPAVVTVRASGWARPNTIAWYAILNRTPSVVRSAACEKFTAPRNPWIASEGIPRFTIRDSPRRYLRGCELRAKRDLRPRRAINRARATTGTDLKPAGGRLRWSFVRHSLGAHARGARAKGRRDGDDASRAGRGGVDARRRRRGTRRMRASSVEPIRDVGSHRASTVHSRRRARDRRGRPPRRVERTHDHRAAQHPRQAAVRPDGGRGGRRGGARRVGTRERVQTQVDRGTHLDGPRRAARERGPRAVQARHHAQAGIRRVGKVRQPRAHPDGSPVITSAARSEDRSR